MHLFSLLSYIQYSSHPWANLVPRVWVDSTCRECHPGTAQGPCGLAGNGALWKRSQLFCSCQSFPPTSIQFLLPYLKLLVIRNTLWFVVSPANAEQNEYIFLRQLLIPLWCRASSKLNICLLRMLVAHAKGSVMLLTGCDSMVLIKLRLQEQREFIREVPFCSLIHSLNSLFASKLSNSQENCLLFHHSDIPFLWSVWQVLKVTVFAECHNMREIRGSSSSSVKQETQWLLPTPLTMCHLEEKIALVTQFCKVTFLEEKKKSLTGNSLSVYILNLFPWKFILKG